MSSKKLKYFIIGYMGSGKTTVGKVLAEKSGRGILDMDEEIEQKQGMTIDRIFMKYGEHHYRNLEGELLDEIVKNDGDDVISCGGGIVLDGANREILKDEFVILLDCDPDIMFERVRNNPSLPNAYFHIEDENERKKIFTGQFEQRRKYYDEIFDIKVNTGKKDVNNIVKEIIEKIGEDA